MRKLLLLLIYFLGHSGFCQVGIAETNPQAMLDINGDLIIKDVPLQSSESYKVLTLNSVNNKIEYFNKPKSFLKGVGGTGFSILSLTLLSGWNKISFPVLEFDENNDFDLSNQFFTAPMDGIYNISVYVKMSSLISLSNFGVGIFKESSGTTLLVSDETYESLSVSILGIGVTSPPTRSSQTLIKLNQGDKILFGVKSSDLTVLNNAEAQFSIFQVR